MGQAAVLGPVIELVRAAAVTLSWLGVGGTLVVGGGSNDGGGKNKENSKRMLEGHYRTRLDREGGEKHGANWGVLIELLVYKS